jgi:hypothetical protein
VGGKIRKPALRSGCMGAATTRGTPPGTSILLTAVMLGEGMPVELVCRC